MLMNGYKLDLVVKFLEVNNEFMDKQFTKVMKGITITMVFFSHLGNANNVRLFAPLGGAIFLILSGYGLNESAKKGFQAKRFWIKRITTVIVPYFLRNRECLARQRSVVHVMEM